MEATGEGNEALLDKYKGAMLGMAVCDALGTTLEFQKPESFVPITTIVGGGPFKLLPGQWTDDTSLGLCMAESLIDKKGFVPTDHLEKFVAWYNDGHLSCTGECFDIGMTTRVALNKFVKTHEPYPASVDSKSAGNGALMRLVPVPLFYGPENQRAAVHYSGLSSRTTHGSPISVDSCRYYAALILGALKGVSKETLLSKDFYLNVENELKALAPAEKVEGEEDVNDEFKLISAPEVIAIAEGSFKEKQPPEIKASGYVVESMEAALWAFYHTNSFEEGALKAVNLGDDADTVGAIYGQLAGAYYGLQGIPKEWYELCCFKQLIEMMGKQLYLFATTTTTTENSGHTFNNDVEVSEEYLKAKAAYDYLEKAYAPIHRKIKPCPRQYKNMADFDNDVSALKEGYKTEVPEGNHKEGLLNELVRVLDGDRSKMELIVHRSTAYSTGGSGYKFKLNP